MPNSHWIHFGCGLCAPEEWTNFDCSPTLRLQRLPLVGSLVPSGRFGRFPGNVLYGDVVKGLPVPPRQAELLYCSHVLEHLALSDLRHALLNCRKALRSGGTFRLVVPDLEHYVREYLADDSAMAAMRFMQHTDLGRASRPKGGLALVREWVGNSHHLWMWDFKALAQELANAGFCKVRRAAFDDAKQSPFRLVESEDRWRDAVGIECVAL
jgi:hypothetical protein